MMTLAQAHALLPGSTLVGDGATPIARVHSDTRSLQPGDLFVALRGERFDAHDFLPQARASGAVAAIAERGLQEAGLAGLIVPDTQRALTELAKAWRQRFQLPMIAVAGSNGKTTVTQMIASILRAWLNDSAFATVGNFNNHIGVPLTLLRLRQDDTAAHRAGVVELGMNHPGEIAELAAITAPTVALVNNAQREHQEFMATVEAVAHENGAVISALGSSGVAVFPNDEEFAPVWHALAGHRPTLTFALSGPADVTCHAEWARDHWAVLLQTPAGALTVQLQVAGWHNVKNALAAATCALAAGCPLEAIGRGLEAFAPVKGRSQIKRLPRVQGDAVLIDDTYNANPDSVRAAIEVLASLPGPRWLILGDMGEVGDQGDAFHREVGAFAKARGIDALWTVGSASAYATAAFGRGHHYEALGALINALPLAPLFNAVVVKGSRFMKMEQVVAALVAETADQAPGAAPADGEAPHAA
ncbi:MAG TPA: UDP-N-acetylmuramoyl-tripeptide--D-alanyl-D-alanine ligase [Burkholderiaceae bacterium]